MKIEELVNNPLAEPIERVNKREIGEDIAMGILVVIALDFLWVAIKLGIHILNYGY